MEAYHVHECHHRVGRDFVHVVERVTRTVVACGENEQVGIECAKRVGYITEAWETLNGCVHVVGRENVYLFVLFCHARHGGEHQQ